MPVTRGAKKTLRQDRRRFVENRKTRSATKTALSSFLLHPTQKALRTAYRVIDLAVKKGIFHKNKASRMKTRFAAKLRVSSVAKKGPKKTVRTRPLPPKKPSARTRQTRI